MNVQQIHLPSIGITAYIQRLVASSYGIDMTAMTSPVRRRSLAWPRQVAMYLTRETTHKSLPNIGRQFGYRDHSTVFHAIKQVEKRMAADPLYRADVEALRKALS